MKSYSCLFLGKMIDTRFSELKNRAKTIRMLDKHINMNIAEPLLPTCPIGYVSGDTARRGGADLWVACAVSPVLTGIHLPPPPLYKH